jgi:hypothetical protein
VNVPDEDYSRLSNLPAVNVPDEDYSRLSNLSAVNVPDEDYSRNTWCALSLISTFLFKEFERKSFLRFNYVYSNMFSGVAWVFFLVSQFAECSEAKKC